MGRRSDDDVDWDELAVDQLRAIAPWPDPEQVDPGAAVVEAEQNDHPNPRVNPG